MTVPMTVRLHSCVIFASVVLTVHFVALREVHAIITRVFAQSTVSVLTLKHTLRVIAGWQQAGV